MPVAINLILLTYLIWQLQVNSVCVEFLVLAMLKYPTSSSCHDWLAKMLPWLQVLGQKLTPPFVYIVRTHKV